MLTVEDLTQAIKNGIDSRKGMDMDEAYDLAHSVLNFFGYSDRIIDNVLEAQDRNAFYILEDADILTTEREETTLYDGREWRIHYWVFKRDKIDELMSKPAGSDKGDDVEENIYDTLDDEAWVRNK
ncbi:MAG: hypothetical protein IKM91_05325 [Candidatus Methanomethylophilaceae archaeon]|nr:hypothetical protein [Candidatus Methanomethylophilaceae archaeon]MBR4181718.1 hypothetical protein [Candidatus Methanomethylophilaceae archaeon]MBR4216667.1 hypothetical protein [Candidatus Methanomethylophilaceae archaeon]MBR4697825.1 hypothetical protein [Candidatus Methanomethylophilaceae archaeon]MBR6871021.1 hypothetical protein [Candidatus Methanomethylophilaceae archaeon]